MERTVNSYIMKTISFFLVIILLFSCENKENSKDDNTYKIISLLYQQYAKPIEAVFPPPPPDNLNYIFSYKDSIKADSLLKKLKEETNDKKSIIAIYPYFSPHTLHDKNATGNCHNFNDILKKYIKNKDSLKIDVNKIITNRNDSIIYYDKLSKDKRKDFYNFDMLISFSNISFNSDYTKAIVVGSFSHSKLAGASMLFFLEKKEGQWMVKCEKGLSIS